MNTPTNRVELEKIIHVSDKIVTVESHIVIHQPVEKVFRYVAIDFFVNYPRWMPSIVGSEKTSEGPIGNGTTGRQVFQEGRQRLETSLQVSDYEPNRKISIFNSSGPYLKLGFQFEPVQEGTHLICMVELEVKGPIRWFRPLLTRRARQVARRIVINLRDRLEAWNKVLEIKQSLIEDITQAQALLPMLGANPSSSEWEAWIPLSESIYPKLEMYLQQLNVAGSDPEFREPACNEVLANLDQFYACTLAVFAMELVRQLALGGRWYLDTITSAGTTKTGTLINTRKQLLIKLGVMGQSEYWSDQVAKPGERDLSGRFSTTWTPQTLLSEAYRLAPQHPFVYTCRGMVR